MKDLHKSKSDRKPKRRRILKFLSLLLLIFLVLAFFTIPAVISSETGRRFILGKIEDATGGQADYSDLKMGWTKGVRVSEVSFNDKTGSVAVHVDQISTKPHYTSLLSGKISLGKTVIDKPRVHIDLRKAPQDEEGSSGVDGPSTVSSQLPLENLDLVVNDGNFKVTDRTDASSELADINSQVQISGGDRLKASFAVAIPDGAQVSTIAAEVSVVAAPKEGFSLKGTNGSVTAEIRDLNIETLGPLLALAGVKVEAKGSINGSITSQISDGEVADFTGNIKARNIDVAPEQLKGDRIQTEKLDLDVKLTTKAGMVNIDKLDLASDFASLNATGSLPSSLSSLEDFLDSESKAVIKGNFDCDVAAVTAQLPKTLHIKEGMQITSGKIAGDISTTTVGGERKIQAKAALTDLTGVVDDKKLALDRPVNLNAQIASSGQTTRFDELKLTSSFATVTVSGTTEKIDYDAQADLAQLQSQVGQFVDFGAYTLAGRLTGRGQIAVSEEKIDEVGAWVAKGLAFAAKEGAEPVKFDSDVTVTFNGSMDRTKSLFNIKQFMLDSDLAKIETNQAVIPYGENVTDPMAISIATSDANLAKIQPFIAQFAELPEKWTMSGVAQSTIKVASIKDGYSIKTDGATIEALKITSPDTEPFTQSQVKVKLDSEVFPKLGGFNLKNFAMDSPQFKLQAAFSKMPDDNKTDLKGVANTDFDWATAGTLARPFMPEGLELQGQRTMSVNFASLYPAGQNDQLLANLDAQAKFGFDKASYMGLNFDAVDTNMNIQKGVANLAPFSTTVNNGTFGFAGKIDFNEDSPALKLPKPTEIAKGIEVNKETTKKLLKYVNPIFADVTAIKGVANFDCEKMSIPLSNIDTNDIEVTGTLAMDDITLQGSGFLETLLSVSGGATRGAKLTVRPTHFVVADGLMKYTDTMQIEVGDNPFNFKGGIHLDGRFKDFSVITPYTTAGRTVNVNKESPGERIVLPVEGTVKDYKIPLEKVLEQNLKDKAIKEGLKLLDGLFK